MSQNKFTVNYSVGPTPASENKFNDIKSLDCYEDLIAKMRGNWPMVQIVKWLQEDQHVLKHLKPESLRVRLFQFRKTIPDFEMVAENVPPHIVERAMSIEHGLNELDELEDLYRKQKHRITRGMELEEKINFMTPSLVYAFKDARETLGLRASLKIKLGIGMGPEKPRDDFEAAATRAVANEIRDEKELDAAEERAINSVAPVISDPKSRGKIIGLVKALASLGRHADVDGLVVPEVEDLPDIQKTGEG